MPYSLVYLLLCLSLRSTAISTASRLGVFDKENNKGTSHLFGKVNRNDQQHACKNSLIEVLSYRYPFAFIFRSYNYWRVVHAGCGTGKIA